MRSTRKLLGLGLAAGTLAFAGCAPVAAAWGHGPGLQLGISPGAGLELLNSQCSMMGAPGLGSPFMRTGSAASVAMSRMQQVSRIESRLRSGIQGIETRMQGWKSIAGGGC